MNHWVGICEWQSFPFFRSTPPVGSFLRWQLYFHSKVFSFCTDCQVLPTETKRWSEAGTSVQMLSIPQTAPRDALSSRARLTLPFMPCVFRSASVSGRFSMCQLQPLLSQTQSGLLHREVAGSKVLYTIKYLQEAGFVF